MYFKVVEFHQIAKCRKLSYSITISTKSWLKYSKGLRSIWCLKRSQKKFAILKLSTFPYFEKAHISASWEATFFKSEWLFKLLKRLGGPQTIFQMCSVKTLHEFDCDNPTLILRYSIIIPNWLKKFINMKLSNILFQKIQKSCPLQFETIWAIEAYFELLFIPWASILNI